MIIKCLTLVEAFIDITIYDNRVFNSNQETKARPMQPHPALSFDTAQEPRPPSRTERGNYSKDL
jgi:hypothetical protein